MPDRYAVVGNPVAHSKSPQIHAAFAHSTGADMSYERLLAPLGDFDATVDAFARGGGRGLNVTVPFKLEAFALASAHSARAGAAGAVNTLARRGDGWFGDNTDGAGVIRDLTVNLGVDIAGRDVLVLGAGGATRGILDPLLAQHPRSLVVSNRTPEKAVELARRFAADGPVSAAAADALGGRRFDLVINSTSASLGAGVDVHWPWPATVFAPGALAYDLVYADVPTRFLQWAKASGAALAVDGLGMLIEQAAESFLLWRGIRPDTAPVFALLRPVAAR